MGYTLTTAPAEEPLSLDRVKEHLKVDISDDDVLIGLLIIATRGYAEHQTGRSLVTQEWRYTCDAFPGWCDGGGAALLLEKGPFQSIDGIGYTDMGGDPATWSPTDYVADLTGPLARIAPRFGKTWPIALPQLAAVQIDFTAGYGAAVDVPQGIKQWMLLRIGALYENREEIAVGRGIVVPSLPFVDGLLDPFSVKRV